MTLVRLAEVAPQPWRNGAGRTRELLALPDAARWQVRVSVAEVEVDGPFSAYPDTERWFAVLEGEGVALTIDGCIKRVTRESAPLRFPGAAATSCRLIGGPTLDLNLMLHGTGGGMQAVAGGVDWRPSSTRCGVFARLAGRCTADGVATELPAHALLWFERAPATLSFTAAPHGPAAPLGFWIEAGGERRS